MTREQSSWTKSKWLWLPISLLLIVGIVLVGAVVGRGGIASKPVEEEPPQITAPDLEEVTPATEPEAPASSSPKLDSSLNQLLDAYKGEGLSGAQAFATSRTLNLVDGQVHVEIVAAAGDMPALQGAVEAAGGEYRGHYQDLMEATVPIEELEPLAARPEVQRIREPHQAMPGSSP